MTSAERVNKIQRWFVERSGFLVIFGLMAIGVDAATSWTQLDDFTVVLTTGDTHHSTFAGDLGPEVRQIPAVRCAYHLECGTHPWWTT